MRKVGTEVPVCARPPRIAILSVAAAVLASLTLVCAAQAPPPTPPSAEIQTQSAPLVFSSKVDLVSVPVVVRDQTGHALGNLERPDFQIFDNGRPQIVSRFSVEKFGEMTQAIQPAAPAAAPVSVPERYVAYLFDDAHMRPDHLAAARVAAWRRISTTVNPAERIGIYTSTGMVGLDFTNDRDQLHKAIDKIYSQNAIVQATADCPQMSIYLADLLWNKKDPIAYSDLESDVQECLHQQLNPDEADFRIENAAKMKLALADRYIRESLDTLDALIRKMSMMAGQRTVVLVSDGYYMLDDRRQDEQAVFEHALHANVVINSLDAKALAALDSISDASARATNLATIADKQEWAKEEALADRAVMAETAANTGGTFIENSNDLDAGFARIAEAPEFIYVLGFNPDRLQSDGKYHNLKIQLRNAKGLAIEARRGYYAPRFSADSAQRAKEEIEEAFFSRDEIHDIPVLMQTQFFKSSDFKATVSIAAKVDVRQIQFRRDNDRNCNDLAVVSGLFDTDGNFVTGTQKTVQLRLLDATLQNKLSGGLSVKTTFDVTPGNYLVRLVVRDSEGRMMAAANSALQIP